MMRVRAQDANGDYTFGSNSGNFLINSSAAVAQIIQTRLLLFLGEWFLDNTDGTDWDNSVLGKYTSGLYDPVIQARILGSPGVTGINNYSSSVNSASRALTIICNVSTTFSAEVPVSVTFSNPNPS